MYIRRLHLRSLVFRFVSFSVFRGEPVRCETEFGTRSSEMKWRATRRGSVRVRQAAAAGKTKK